MLGGAQTHDDCVCSLCETRSSRWVITPENQGVPKVAYAPRQAAALTDLFFPK